MRNLRFKRKTKSAESDEVSKRRKVIHPLEFKAVLKKETAIKSKASDLNC